MIDTTQTQRICMIWPTLDATVQVDLHWEIAPRLCELITAELPFSSVQEHGLIAGAMLYATTRISTLVRENVTTFTEMQTGACYFACGSQNLGVVYGPVTEPEGHSVWGVIPAADLTTLERVGRAIWQNTLAPFGNPAQDPAAKRIIPVRFERA